MFAQDCQEELLIRKMKKPLIVAFIVEKMGVEPTTS